MGWYRSETKRYGGTEDNRKREASYDVSTEQASYQRLFKKYSIVCLISLSITLIFWLFVPFIILAGIGLLATIVAALFSLTWLACIIECKIDILKRK